MRIDRDRRITMVAIGTAANDRREILAVARAYASTDGTAELALLVRSDLKGKRLGSLLLERLIARCRRRGLRGLTAVVLQGNTRMLRLAAKHGFRREPSDFGVTNLALELNFLSA